MFTQGRRGAARLAAALLASGLMAAGAVAGAGPAAADGGATQANGGATATLHDLVWYDEATVRGDGASEQVPAGLFKMRVDGGGYITTYCIDLHRPTQPRARYQEVPWSQSTLHANPNAGKIEWILQNSYPQQDNLQKLAQEAGAGPLSPSLAAAGTQVAIWRYSDNADVTADNPSAEKLADYLTRAAGNLGEPAASLALTPSAVSGKSGTRIGPVAVHTNAQEAQVGLTPQSAGTGVTIVDKNGKPVDSAVDGTQLYFDVPAGTPDGSATLTVQATTKVPVGRAFEGLGSDGQPSQMQILAGSSDSTVSAQATATWAKQGPIPSISAMVDCARNGVDVLASNEGDEAFTFRLAGKQYTVAPGASQTITVPVAEGQAYNITMTGPKGFSKTFTGVLDCKPSGAGASPSPSPSPASGTSPSGGSAIRGKNLAETGAGSATPLIAGAAVALVAIGGGTVFLLRKRKTPSGG